MLQNSISLLFLVFIVYILKSQKNKANYIGCTENLERRIKEHNKGYVKSTKSNKPWRIVYKEEWESLSLARKRERKVKSWKKRDKIEELTEFFKIK